MKITVVGAGYVGISNALLLAQKHDVVVYDISEERVALLNRKVSPITDALVSEYLETRDLTFRATASPDDAYRDAELVIVATPTNYDEATSAFDTHAVDNVIFDVLQRDKARAIVIKSTIPVGHTAALNAKFGTDKIVFCPEFLREGSALYDNLHPSRIVIGTVEQPVAQELAELFRDCAIDQDMPVVYATSTEAESIKLFANTYLAMRVAYFNELDTYAQRHGLDSLRIINGVSSDPRIGAQYNNPSFGYGGYCLPKDTRQLLANYVDVPQRLMKAIVEANEVRKEFIADAIIERRPAKVGIYRLTMKSGSDNFRDSSILSVMERLRTAGLDIVIYEPMLDKDDFDGFPLCRNLDEMKASCDVIVANRFDAELDDVQPKVFTRDLFRAN